MISLCFLGIYHRSDCYFWLSMICANSARRLLRTPWRLNFLYKYCAVISSYFLGTYQRSDCYSWLIMICANSVRRLLRTPWLTCLRTKMVNMVCWLNPKLISQTQSSTSKLDSKNATCIYYAVLVVWNVSELGWSTKSTTHAKEEKAAQAAFKARLHTS